MWRWLALLSLCACGARTGLRDTDPDTLPAEPCTQAARDGSGSWSRAFGPSEPMDWPSAVAVDERGNAYVTGAYTTPLDLGGGALRDTWVQHGFVTSYSSCGDHRWSRAFGDPANLAHGFGIVAHATEAVIVGDFSGTTDFGGEALTSAGECGCRIYPGDRPGCCALDAFLAAYDTLGEHLVSRRFGGRGMDRGFAVPVDPAGNAYAGGMFAEAMEFDGRTIEGAGSVDGFVASLDPDGAHRWSLAVGGTGIDSVGGVAVDDEGNVYMAGTFQGEADIGDDLLRAAEGTGTFVASFDASGAHRWSLNVGAAGPGMLGMGGPAIAADGAGNAYVAGTFAGPVDFGGGPLPGSGVVASLRPDGVHRWSRWLGDSTDVGAVAADGEDQVCVVGAFSETVQIGGFSLTSAGGSDGLVACFGLDGALRGAHRLGGAGDDVARAVAMDGEGGVLVAGTFEGAVDLGQEPLGGDGRWLFLLRFVP